MVDVTSTIAVVVAITGPIGAYLVAAKRFSGKIESSDAKELWSESRSIREWSHEQIESLSEDVKRLQQQVIDLSFANVKLREELSKAYQRIAELEKEVNGNAKH